ncbi:MAG: helix-turn-helix transcriptional regulator [Paludibacterium sp.]|uniref:helix-turn-helix domain-containing protein n=1 Tax=Paludibacterium sp. TaxID=1917523 RepID=UPI0025CF8059|nr:helix-turn-helix domain-containing protein [Paludibacterium sp.]MBV8048378.1 helix-turn-helix transcriptional regulator [Paludibacterium sp.]MBV8649034.1 helix-turn-helix transcriptional regulator [Paludibacterium sp.]
MERNMSRPIARLQKRVSCSNAVTLGQAVANSRRKQGLTQGELAEFAGVGITFVNQLEKGKGTVRLELVLKVLQTLNVQLELILPEFQDD